MFHVYPDNQSAPLQVQPGQTESVTFEQITGPAEPAGSYPKMIFLRVAASGGTSPPALEIQAGSGTTADVTQLPTAVRRGGGGYVGDVWLIGEGDLVQQVRLGFVADSAPDSWRIGVRNTGGAPIDVTLAVAGTVAETAQPWISAPGGLVAFHGLVGERIPQQVTIVNKGTGPLVFPAPGPALPAGFAITSPLPLAIPPNHDGKLEITFTAPATPPGTNGSMTVTADLTSDPPDPSPAPGGAGHNHRLTLATTTQALEVVLLLDASGSMGDDPQGGTPAAKALSRWGELTSAANQFLDMLAHFAEKRGRFGVARFPATDPSNPATYDIVPMRDIPGVPGMAAAQAAISAITPDGGTPMGNGLDRVLAPATGYFATDPLSLAANRRWLILLSDGANNEGPHSPLEFIAAPGSAAPGDSLEDRKIHLFAVAYGIDGFTDVDHNLMKQLAAGSLGGGQTRNVDDEHTTATLLAQSLRDALKSGLTATSSPRDPAASYPGQGELRHEAVLLPFDGRACFVVSWNTPQPGRLRLELVSPAGETFSPDFTLPGIDVRSGDRHQMYLLDADFLQGRYGTWTLVVTGPAPEDYVYDVLTETDLSFSVRTDKFIHWAGDAITVSATLSGAAGPVAGASVSLTADVPATSVANWLAAQHVPDDAMQEARRRLDGKDSSPLLVKALGAQIAGISYDPRRATVTLPMTDPGHTGVYSATLTATTVPERYSFAVTAVGQIGGVGYRREGTTQTFVLVHPTKTQIDVAYTGRDQAVATITPVDEYGNVLLVDPSIVPLGLGTDVRSGQVVSNLDGTYKCPFGFDPNRGSDIVVTYGGDAVGDPVQINPPDRLTFPDKVVSFRPGVFQEAARIPRPEDVLGGIAGKERALPLGAGGSVAVAFDGHVVLAEGGTDVTVFTGDDGDPRAYRLEALDSARRVWVSVGESRGGTTSFRLAGSGLAVTPALRVTDLSERTRDRNGRALDNPGVNVCGLGVLTTAPADAMAV